MGLLSRSSTPKAAKAAKTPRPVVPRVRLRPEELKLTNRLSTKEQYVGYALAVYAVGIFLWRTFAGGVSEIAPKFGLVGEMAWLVYGVVAAIALVLLSRFTNRLGVTIGAVACAMWQGDTPSFQLLAYPFLGFTLYLTLAMSRSKRALMNERVANGDFADPIAERRNAKSKPTTAKEDATGRAYASKSKRYTPPKPAKSVKK
jgi:hypothetical protein